MLRAVLFVDVGYVLACGATVCLGTDALTSVACDYPSLSSALSSWVGDDAGMPLLRSYWYDSVGTHGTSPRLRRLSSTPRVKVRLGALGWNVQKEVDILLHDDLVGLAAGGVVASVYLLSGDADFRPTIARAQSYGVEVVLLDLPAGRAAQSLIREADRHVQLPASFWSPFFALARPSKRRGEMESSPVSDAFELASRQAGADFGRGWLARTSATEVAQLQQQGHVAIPGELDAELIRVVDATTGFLRERPELKAIAREGFWSVVGEADADGQMPEV